MEVIIAMGHFCEIHGPCVIICAQRAEVVPLIPPPSLYVPVCDACESIELDLAYACRDEKLHYVSTRTALDSNMAKLLKEAVVRSLSIETVVVDKDRGTMYFGDNTKGHVITHVFSIKDSLARGFKRKYCIVVWGQHQVPLMHHYNFIEENLEQISAELIEKSDKVFDEEKSLRDDQRAQGATRKPTLRSLKKLVGEPNVFAHIHLWFVFLLRSEIYELVEHNVPEWPVDCPTPKELRDLRTEMPKDIFRTILYCILIGIKVEQVGVDVIQQFRQLLPKGFILTTSGEVCRVSKNDEGAWNVQFKGTLPKHLPRMQLLVEEAIENEKMPVSALKFYLMHLSLRWFNKACVLSWSTGPCDELLRSLEVRKCDMPLLSYWIPQSHACVKINDSDWFFKGEEEGEGEGDGDEEPQAGCSSSSS